MDDQTKHPNPRPRQAAATLFLLPIVMLLGCEATQTERQQAESTPEVQDQAKERAMNSRQSSPASSNPVAGLDALLKKDMAYADVHKLLLDEGWEPVRDTRCQVQVVGDDRATCANNQDLALCKACEQMPELSAYSGDGFATSRFRDVRTGKTLKVISYGMIEDWNVPGEDSRLRIEEWEDGGTQIKE